MITPREVSTIYVSQLNTPAVKAGPTTKKIVYGPPPTGDPSADPWANVCVYQLIDRWTKKCPQKWITEENEVPTCDPTKKAEELVEGKGWHPDRGGGRLTLRGVLPQGAMNDSLSDGPHSPGTFQPNTANHIHLEHRKVDDAPMLVTSCAHVIAYYFRKSSESGCEYLGYLEYWSAASASVRRMPSGDPMYFPDPRLPGDAISKVNSTGLAYRAADGTIGGHTAAAELCGGT